MTLAKKLKRLRVFEFFKKFCLLITHDLHQGQILVVQNDRAIKWPRKFMSLRYSFFSLKMQQYSK